MLMKNSFKIGAYIRVSTQEQAENPEGSIRNQKERIIQTVKLRNMEGNFGEVVDFYTDSGLSGKDTNRPELQRLLKDVRDGKISLVISSELSRISRNMHDFAGIWELFKSHGCSFQSLRENFDTTTAAGEMVLYTIANIAQFERRQVAERVSANMNARAQRGLYNGGPVPYGYELNPDKAGYLKIHPVHSQTVRKVFEMFLVNERLSDTCKWLNDHGYDYSGVIYGGGRRMRTGHFTVDTVRRMIINKAYIGMREFKEREVMKTVEAVWEPIIEKNLFDKANEVLSRGNHQRKKATTSRFPYLLTGLVFCQKCGDVMCGKSAWGKVGKVGYYEHSWATKKDSTLSSKILKCSPHRVPAKKLEPLVIDELFKLLTQEDLLKDLLREANNFYEDQSVDKEKDKLKLKELSYNSQLDALAARLAELPVNISAKPIYEQMAIIEAKKTEVVEKSQSLVGPCYGSPVEFTDIKRFGDSVKEILLGENNPDLKALVISKFVKKVEVSEDSITVHYFVGEEHFKRELALASSLSFSKNLGSNRLTSGGTNRT